ncbi:MAG: hypothetical protein CVU46_11240 [Chloroflexi bacterium HGW-Chloroflexi-8]|nr:MAG: hypothetical protein CVU46_11240 [Chloroflexi bacterium HGW-Chloroflexi-8]
MHAIYLKINQDVFTLHGEGLAPPLRGCSRQPTQLLSNGHCLERLILVIQGTPAQSRQVLARLQSFLERIHLGQEAALHLQVEPRSDFYHSRLYRGDFTWVANSVQVKGFGLELELERDDFWEGATHSLPLSNRHGTQVSGGLQVDNRSDGYGENQLTWASGEVLGELPTPAQLFIIHDQDPTHSFRNIYTGMLRGIEDNLPVIEGELADSGVTFNIMLDPACNGGSYGRAQWSGNTEMQLFSWNFSQVFTGSLTGLPLRPYLRFPVGFVCEQDIWLYWTLDQDGLIYQSEPIRLETDRQLQALPILRLPAACSAYENLADIQVNLVGKAVSSGPHTLSLDAVFLLGLDGFRHYQALEGGQLNSGKTLVDLNDQSPPILVNEQDQKIQRTFQSTGAGIWLTPYEHQSLGILLDQGADMPLGSSVRVEIRYRPRVRVLP